MVEDDTALTGLGPSAEGLWFIYEAAADLAKQEAMGSDGYRHLARRMGESATLPPDHPQHLCTRHIGSRLPLESAASSQLARGVYATDVNAWLERLGAVYRWQSGGVTRPLHPVIDLARIVAAQRFPMPTNGSDDAIALAKAWQGWMTATLLVQVNGYQHDRKIGIFIGGKSMLGSYEAFSASKDAWFVDDAGRKLLLRLFEQDTATVWPIFDLPPRATAVPAVMRLLPAGTRVRVRESWNKRSEAITVASEAIESIEDTVRRQAQGWFRIIEAAAVMEEFGCGQASGWRDKFIAAAETDAAEALPMHEPETLGRIVYGATPQAGEGRRARDYYDWVHLDDLDRWLETHEPRLPFRFASLSDYSSPKLDTAPTPRPVQRAEAQDAAILAKLAAMGHEPTSLPRGEPGRPGVKAAVRRALLGAPLFQSDVIFDKAWQRLRANGGIAEA